MGAIEVREASEADLDDLTAIAGVVEAADPRRRAEVPVVGRHELDHVLFRVPARKPARTWIALGPSSVPLGFVTTRFPMATDRHHVEVRVEVVPDARRHGVASTVLRAALAAIDPTRTLIDAHVEAGPALAWCEALGLESRLVVRQNVLDITACDLDLVRSWLDPPEALAAGYRIVSWRGPTPVDRQPAVCAALAAMADAPMDDADHEEPPITPELLRDGEESARPWLDQFGALALAPDGGAAGFSELAVHRDRPVLADQGDTGVVAGHRGHRLGRWLKARNLLAAWGANPELRVVETYNAASNPWMLAINDDMGFRPHRTVHLFQGPTQTARDHVASRPVG